VVDVTQDRRAHQRIDSLVSVSACLLDAMRAQARGEHEIAAVHMEKAQRRILRLAGVPDDEEPDG
jgi:hypothetical protein